MTVIVLATICFLGCGFLLYVLFQWTRETKRKRASRSAIGDEVGQAGQKRQPYIVGSRGAAKRHDRTKSSLQIPSIKGESRGCEAGRNECAHERTAESVRLGKKR
jgi:hypothetical protein